MLAGFVSGQCVQPVYWMADVNTAASCGLKNGVLYATLASLIGIAVLAGHTWKASWTMNSSTTPITSTFPIRTIFLVYLLTVWLVLPIMFRLSAINQWNGYQAAINQLMTDYNLPKLAAINIVAEWKTGTLDAGGTSIISGAALLGTNNNGRKAEDNNKSSTPAGH